MSDGSIRLLLLRHAEVVSHRGDVPITAAGTQQAAEVGRRLGGAHPRIRILSGSTARTRETAAAIAAGALEEGAEVLAPTVAFALRNPDLYLAGQRVDMVSSGDALAAQLHGVDAETAAASPFFHGFLAAEDRIGWWLRQTAPPGDDPTAVAARIRSFAASLMDFREPVPITVGVTHSPVLRAVAREILDRDPGEPAWIAGASIDVHPDRSVDMHWLEAAP